MTKQELTAKVNAYRGKLNTATETLDDKTALDVVALFPAWAADVEYIADQRVRYDGKLFRIVQSHTSQSDWTPDVTPALYTEVAEPGTIPVWRKPTGAQDAYTTGDKVHYPTADDAVWVSTVDNNVWEPGVYGWEED